MYTCIFARKTYLITLIYLINLRFPLQLTEISVDFLCISSIVKYAQNLIVCLYGVFRPTQEYFTHFGDVTITGEELQFFALCSLGTHGH